MHAAGLERLHQEADAWQQRGTAVEWLSAAELGDAEPHLRAAVEATVRSVKHPFGNGKVSVRGKARVSMIVIGSAAMGNVRRIYRYQIARRKAEEVEKARQKEITRDRQLPITSLFVSCLAQLRSSLSGFRPVWTCSF